MKMKKWIGWLLLFAVCLSLCACSSAPQGSGAQNGGSRPKKSSEPVGIVQEAQKNVVQRLASTEIKPPEGENINWISSLAKMDGRLYFKTQSMEGCRLFSTDLNGEDRQELSSYNGEIIQGFAASDHGTLYVLNNPYNEDSRLYEYSLQEIDKTGAAVRTESQIGRAHV